VFFYRGFDGPLRTIERFVAILKSADRYDMKQAKTYAQTGIESLYWLGENDVHLMELSRLHRVDKWFEDAFQNLIYRRLTSFTTAEIDTIGF
jgi:hypothetical protein